MPQNKLIDLNNHLFAQLERLSDEGITEENLAKEVNRAKSINEVAKNIIENAKTSLDGVRLAYSSLEGREKMPDQFLLAPKTDNK